MWYEAASEVFALILSSAGVAGTAAALVFGYIMKRAKQNAEKRRDERLKLDILRLEGEEKLS
ncbi:MAG: hypothetical protein J5793_00770, partial [Clostridia bacterium]|nr:hypothetical protein [Clostridia bacterium]